MKRKLIICSSLITIILSCFSFPIFAEETVQDSSNLHSLSDGVFLDSYFYDNYDLLPYLQSSGTQYINTGVSASSDLKVNMVLSDISDADCALFGESLAGKSFLVNFYYTSDNYNFYFGSGSRFIGLVSDPYYLIDITFDRNNINLNNQTTSLAEATFSDGYPIFIFGRNNGSTNDYRFGTFKLYKFSIYDYSLNDGVGEYVRYYYPAKAKTSGSLGLYDAISKTFFVSSTNSVFVNPTDEYVENFQISSFLSNSLTWIGQIFDAIVQMPIIIVFMAIGLAGAMFRWGRRIVHF